MLTCSKHVCCSFQQRDDCCSAEQRAEKGDLEIGDHQVDKVDYKGKKVQYPIAIHLLITTNKNKRKRHFKCRQVRNFAVLHLYVCFSQRLNRVNRRKKFSKHLCNTIADHKGNYLFSIYLLGNLVTIMMNYRKKKSYAVICLRVHGPHACTLT